MICVLAYEEILYLNVIEKYKKIIIFNIRYCSDWLSVCLYL